MQSGALVAGSLNTQLASVHVQEGRVAAGDAQVAEYCHPVLVAWLRQGASQGGELLASLSSNAGDRCEGMEQREGWRQKDGGSYSVHQDRGAGVEEIGRGADIGSHLAANNRLSCRINDGPEQHRSCGVRGARWWSVTCSGGVGSRTQLGRCHLHRALADQW